MVFCVVVWVVRCADAGTRSTVVVGKPVVVVVRRIVVVVVNWPLRCKIVVVTALRATVVVGNALPGFLVTVVTTNTVVVELTTVVEVLSTEAVGAGAEGTMIGATGVMANMLDAAPGPTMLIARTITSYSTPFVSPPILSGDVIEPVGHAVQVTPLSNEYSWLSSDEPPLLPSAKLAEMAPSLAVSEFNTGA